MFLIFVFVFKEKVLKFSLDAMLVCCSFVLIFAIFSLIGSFRFIFGIWWSLDLYFGLFITIKYYVSLNSIDDVYYTYTIKPKNKRKPTNPTKPFLNSETPHTQRPLEE